jgi:hypothetical protein
VVVEVGQQEDMSEGVLALKRVGSGAEGYGDEGPVAEKQRRDELERLLVEVNIEFVERHSRGVLDTGTVEEHVEVEDDGEHGSLVNIHSGVDDAEEEVHHGCNRREGGHVRYH